MLGTDHKKRQASPSAGQAATELAIFGAILIFILGAIVRTAAGNSYAPNQNFKAMRMAMLASWRDSQRQSTAHNSASVLFLEDRLSPDLNKYGDLERTPFIANGSGSFSYMLEYPLDASDLPNSLPIMDIYINGQHFPFTTASHVIKEIYRPGTHGTAACGTDGPYPNPPPGGGVLTQEQCMQNQCLRNQREWVGGSISANQFQGITLPSAAGGQAPALGTTIFNDLIQAGLISSRGQVYPIGNAAAAWATFTALLQQSFPAAGTAQITQIQNILLNTKAQYKLFYTMAVNGTPQFYSPQATGSSPGSSSGCAPVCSSPPCKDAELSTDAQLPDSTGNMHGNQGSQCGDLLYDLQRLGVYDHRFNPSYVDNNTSNSMRPYMAWQWSATAAIVGGGNTDKGADPMIGLDPPNAQYPQYDIDGRLKMVTIYSIVQDTVTTGAPNVEYEDFQGGDIDGEWDINSCGPKPGLQNSAKIYTFTKDGTYLHVKEGKMYNPETDQFVRSANQRDTVDMIERAIQLSNNTYRFCTPDNTPQPCVAGCLVPGGICAPNQMTCPAGAAPNPVEACVDGATCTCFMNSTVNPQCGNTIASTCFDAKQNVMYVRSRIEDRGGRFWMTDTNGQLKVQ